MYVFRYDFFLVLQSVCARPLLFQHCTIININYVQETVCLYVFRYDFFLVSQSVRQGTVAPTHYNVIHDTTALKPDHMQRLAYKLCHLYYNWPVSIIALCFFHHWIVPGWQRAKMPNKAYLAFQRNLVVEIFFQQFGTFLYTTAQFYFQIVVAVPVSQNSHGPGMLVDLQIGCYMVAVLDLLLA